MDLQVTLFQDFAEDRRLSMERYSDGLLGALRTHFPERCRVLTYRPHFPTRLGARGWGLRMARFLLYPQQARSHQTQVNHVLDHGYGHLLYVLDPARSVVTVHDIIPLVRWRGGIPNASSGRKPWLNLFSFYALRRAAHLIADSENTQRDLIQFCRCKSEKISIVGLGVHERFRVYSLAEKAEAHRKLNLPTDGTQRILISGSGFYKNQLGALRAFVRLRELHGGALELFKLGPPTHEWRRTVRELGLEQVARCLGYINDNEMPDLYNSVQCLLFPSFYEGFGWPPVEAMACGTPVVASNAASLPEVIADAGIMCDPQDYDGLAHAMHAVLTNEELRQSLINRGLKRATQFTWERTAQKTLAVYEQVLRG